MSIRIPGGGRFKYLVIAAAVLVFACNLLFVYVKPNEFGIKVVRLGINRAVQQEVYTAGLNLVVPGMQQMYRLPRDVQVLELTGYPRTAADQAREARDRLNEELNSKGIRVEYVLVGDFRYSPEIQKNIEEKKLKDQLVFTNQAAARAAREEAELKKIVQEGRVVVDVEMEQGRAYVTRKIAEKDLYVRAKKAEADLLVKLAEAEKVRLKNDALKGVGSERMVGLKMADVCKGLDLIVLPSDGGSGGNPLDLDNALKRFDVRKGGAQ